MKINIEIDMSPEEARKVMGMPDVEPMQKEMMKKIQEKINASFDEMSDPELFMKRFMPMGIQGLEQLQEFIYKIAKATTGTTNKDQ